MDGDSTAVKEAVDTVLDALLSGLKRAESEKPSVKVVGYRITGGLRVDVFGEKLS